jgi:nucleoside-diphosphate kinase
MAVERTLILAEPDAVARGLSGESVARFERRGFVLGAPLLRVDGALAEQHSAEHIEKPFLGKLVDFIPSGPTVAFVLAEEGAIATNLADADRGSCALAMPSDLVRGSDSPESAEREIAVWFADALV